MVDLRATTVQAIFVCGLWSYHCDRIAVGLHHCCAMAATFPAQAQFLLTISVVNGEFEASLVKKDANRAQSWSGVVGHDASF